MELDSIDISINVKKSCCMLIGVRHDQSCSTITTMDGRELVWADEIRYLGVFIAFSKTCRDGMPGQYNR